MPRGLTSIDRQVGARVRQRRLELGLSQTELGVAVGVSYQQMQKYEGGSNRIGAGRLNLIAEALRVPPSHFFDRADRLGSSRGDTPTYVAQFFAERCGHELARAFVRIKDARVRRRIAKLVEEIADGGAKKG
jgi:transcriptional regulator with XRE-family HTH domain